MQREVPLFLRSPDQGKTDDHGKYQNLEHISLGKSSLTGLDGIRFLIGIQDAAHLGSLDIGSCHLRR